MAALDFLAGELAALDERGLRRRLRQVRERHGSEVMIDGRRVVDFSSNDYLGLASHPAIAEAAGAAALRVGSGAGASRLIVGNLAEHESLEAEIAAFHEAPAALVFNSGYHANLGVLPALAGPDDLIVSDQLNHASLIDGCRLSRARVEVFRHRDLVDAAERLRLPARRRYLVSESLFSMDGDQADLAGLRELADQAGAVLVVDEAHAVGALGPGGRGLAASAGVVPDVMVGTFGKALGGFGAYVTGSVNLREWLVSRARPFVFTTGLPPAVIGGAAASLRLLRTSEGAARRQRLSENIEHLGSLFRSQGLPGSASPIFPVVVGEANRAMALTEELLRSGCYAQGIRPPTVPRGTSRLRISVTAAHRPDDLTRLANALAQALR